LKFPIATARDLNVKLKPLASIMQALPYNVFTPCYTVLSRFIQDPPFALSHVIKLITYLRKARSGHKAGCWHDLLQNNLNTRAASIPI
jgi:hypothetical protein